VTLVFVGGVVQDEWARLPFYAALPDLTPILPLFFFFLAYLEELPFFFFPPLDRWAPPLGNQGIPHLQFSIGPAALAPCRWTGSSPPPPAPLAGAPSGPNPHSPPQFRWRAALPSLVPFPSTVTLCCLRRPVLFPGGGR